MGRMLTADILLKGPEQRLPEGIHFFDKDGHKREEVRLRWWDQEATTFRKAALGLDGREMNCPTHIFRATSDTAKAPLCFLDIIG